MRIFRSLMVVVGVLTAAAALAAEAFVPGLDDLPLMGGLNGRADEAVVFEAPAGRIVEAWADGAVAREAVRDFYRRTLPQLGWRETGADRYRRESETLQIEFPGADPQGARPASGRILVRFYLSPSS